ncbi:MAG: quinone-dependent dihydroorotate dehydrogenase [Salinirussus sp.]
MTLYTALRPLLFALPAETAHGLGKRAMKRIQASGVARSLVRRRYRYRHPALRTEVFGLEFPTPVGVAAGFDKNGEVTHCLADLGFGFTEVGTVTPYPQSGNDRPRLFRLPEDGGMINRLGFNSQGADRVRRRFQELGRPAVPIGLNIGKMNTSGETEAIEDYRRVFDRLSAYPDYFVVNVSCPNTPEEFAEDDPEHVERIFETLDDENDADDPMLVKVGPDSTPEALAELVDIVESVGFDGIVATNTTTDHSGLSGRHRGETGGVSGRPLEATATETVRTLAGLTDLPIVGVGGVRDAAGAYAKIRAGASLVQLYTGFVYRGPSTARQIGRGLVSLLERDGFETVGDAVGADCDS